MHTYRVVVGVDGSEGGTRALRWAAREVAERGGIVQAVAAWQPDAIEAGVPVPAGPAAAREQVQRLLDAAVRTVVAEFPTAILASEVVEGPAAGALTRAARGADLLVLGSHGHSRLRHAVLGSVSDECVRAAACPVVIVPVTPDPAGHA